MIATAITVGSDGAIVMSLGKTYGILVAILFVHGVVCSAATNILARLNLFYVVINGKWLFLMEWAPDPTSPCSWNDHSSHRIAFGRLRRQQGVYQRRVYAVRE
jgi:hypothetical protein